MTNENAVAVVHPEVANFLTTYHSMSAELDIANRTIEGNRAMIATLEDQIDGMREIIKETSAKSDYYMRLCVEMRTHFVAVQSITKEAEKCFASGPYRNNGALSEDALRVQMVADDLNQNGLENEDVKADIEERKKQLATELNPPKIENGSVKIPSFLNDPERKEKLDAKKNKGWNGNK